MEIYIKKDVPFELKEINILGASDDEMMRISEELGVRLSLDEMKRIREHFSKKGRNPYDVEMQSLGQAWSEHCCYKSSKPVLREFVFGLDKPYVIDKGDAGVVEFDEEHAYAIRIESHNHPSAVEPYGGAATGIGGIIRDVLCMGAKPIALADPLFFGPLNVPYEKLPAGTKHPKYLFSGVVAGIRDYGNRVGIPTISGCVVFDESYTGNCLVNVGCVGIAKKKHIIRNAVKKEGDVFVLIGGKTGRDGIHGVTFASVEITSKTEESDRGAVQLGDPIMKEPVIHVCLECAEKGLLDGMKDLGGGGLSCVVGELALSGGFGAEIYLDKVPLKESDMAPWEIWVSESQERMMLVVDEKNVKKVLEICKLWDVPATPIGNVIREKVARLFYKGIKVFEMDLDFLTKGPEYCRRYKRPAAPAPEKEVKHRKFSNYNQALLVLLSDPNIASKEWVIRQYDHEVQGRTVLKPLQGRINMSGAGDASVLKPLENSYKGLAVTIATTPFTTAIDPYLGGMGVIDEMCRGLAAVGAKPHSYTNCLNFGNPEKEERMWELHEAVRGMGEASKFMDIPVPSGNVSLYNESHLGAIKPTITVMGIGIVEDIRKCVTTDFKNEGNSIYLIGKTLEEFGGAAYSRYTGKKGAVPAVDLVALKKSMSAILKVIDLGLVSACHDISDGGLAVALSEMCIGGGTGANIETDNIGSISTEAKLFAESNTRWLVEVKSGKENEFERVMEGLEFYKIGRVGGTSLRICEKGKEIINLPVEKLREAWTKPLWEAMG